MEGGDIGLSDLGAGLAFLIGAVDDLVVHVGKVAHEGHIVADMAQIAGENVEDHGGTGMADMAEVVGSDAAGIHADLTRTDGFKVLLAAGHGIIKLHGDSLKLQLMTVLI